MATALATGWGEPVLCTDVIPEAAERLAAATGGEAVSTNAELAERADLIVLCHKPHQLGQVAEQTEGKVKTVASILSGITLEQLETAYPDRPVIRLMPNTPVAVGRGVVCYAPGQLVDDQLEGAVTELFGRSASVVEIEEKLIDVAMGLMSVAPAYVALVAEAWIDAGIAHGMPAGKAAELVVGALAGSAELLIAQDNDTLRVRRSVMTPGGVTAQGLAALEKGGIRPAFRDALDAVMRHLA